MERNGDFTYGGDGRSVQLSGCGCGNHLVLVGENKPACVKVFASSVVLSSSHTSSLARGRCG